MAPSTTTLAQPADPYCPCPCLPATIVEMKTGANRSWSNASRLTAGTQQQGGGGWQRREGLGEG